MPYIATDLDAFDDADAVAGSTGLSPPLVLGGLARTWRWCWRNKTDRVTAEQLAGFFCSPTPGLPAALVAFGFLEALDTYRVRGVDRYLRLSEVRAAAGKARAEKAKRDAATGQLLPSTQPAHAGQPASTPPAADQPSQRRSKVEGRSTEEEDLPRASPAGAPKVRKPPTQKPADPPRPGWQALIDRLTATYLRLVGAKYDFRGHDAKALAAMLDRGVAADAVEAAWARALAHQGFPAVRTLPELDRNLNHFLGALRRSGPDPNQGITTHEEGEGDVWAAYRANREAEEKTG